MIVLTPQTLVEDWVHVYSNDPALNQDVENFAEVYERWTETGTEDDLKSLTREGQRPTYWKLRHPRGKLREQISDAIKLKDNGVPSNETLFDACRLCLIGADGLGGDDLLQYVHDPATKLKMLSDDSMALLQTIDGGKLVYELGVAAIMKLVPLSKKK